MKNIIKNLLEKLKADPLKAQLLIVLIYPILPLALFASWMILIILSKLSAITSYQEVSLLLLGFIWFIGGPLGLLGGLLILFKKYTRKSVLFFVYGSISYLIIAGAYIYQSIFFIVGDNYWIGLHTLYALFTFWVIGRQLLAIYKNRKNKVSI